MGLFFAFQFIFVHKRYFEKFKLEKKIFIEKSQILLVQVPIFVIQSLFDETQLLEQFSIVKSKSESQLAVHSNDNFLQTINLMNMKVRKNLNKLNSYFIPACISHMILTR
jgi:hypothetical protein